MKKPRTTVGSLYYTVIVVETRFSKEPLEETWSPDCNRTLILSRQSPRASISSPGFPRHYPDNADCDTTIIAPAGFRVVLDFDELVIENEPRLVDIFKLCGKLWCNSFLSVVATIIWK